MAVELPQPQPMPSTHHRRAAMTVVPWASIPEPTTAWWDNPRPEPAPKAAPVEETEPAPAFTAIMTDRPCNSVVRRDPSGQFFIELVPCSSDSESEDDEGPPDHGPLAPASAPSPTSAPPPTSSFCTPAKKAVMDVNVSDTPAKKAKRDGGEEPSGSEEKNQADGGEELSGSKQKPLARFDYILNVGDSQAWPGQLSRYGYEYYARHELAKSRNEDYDYTDSDDSDDDHDEPPDEPQRRNTSGKNGNRSGKSLGKSSRILKRRPNSDPDPFPNGGL